jgi:hypothetical protein
MSSPELILFLWAGHYLADFPLQTSFMAEKKRLAFIETIGLHSLVAHAFTHGLVAGLITQNFTVAIIVGVTHGLIDFGKSSKLLVNVPHTRGARKHGQTGGLYGVNVDQALHFLVVLYVVLVVIK